MGQTVEECSGETLGPKCFGPFVEWQVACDQCGTALIALGDQLEQQLGPGFAQRNKAQFVNDQQLVTDHLFLQPQKPALIPRLHKFMDECGSGDKTDGQALLAC